MKVISNALYESFYKYADKLKGKKVIKLDTVKRLADEFNEKLTAAQPGASGFPFRFPGSSHTTKNSQSFTKHCLDLDPDGVTSRTSKNFTRIIF